MINERNGTSISGDSLINGSSVTAEHATGSITVNDSPAFVYTFSSEVAKAFINTFQDFLNSNEMALTLRAKLGLVNKEVLVVDQDSKLNSENLPVIVVNSVPATGIPVGFGNRTGQELEIDGELYNEYSGLFTFDVAVDVKDTSKASVHSLTDLLILSTFEYLPNKLLAQGITMDPVVRHGVSTRSVGSTIDSSTFAIKMSFRVTTQWTQHFKINAPIVQEVNTTHTFDA